jgi:hypothetical protein
MKHISYLIIIFTILIFAMSGFSQVRFNGWWDSNMYIWENSNENQQYDYYQGLQFRLGSRQNADIYFNTYLRVAYRGDPADWEERIYNMYLNWNPNNNYRFRLGRLFLYQGVINGIVDAFQFSGKFTPRLQFHAVVGVDAPIDRSLDLTKWDEGNIIGGYLSYQLPGRNTIDLSYYQKQRSNELYWQQLGSTFLGYAGSHFNYYLRFDYNLLSNDYQTFRARFTYYNDSWTVSTEYSNQRPRIYDDSFFSTFKVNAHNQFRFAVNHYYNQFDFGFQALRTVYNSYTLFTLHKDNYDLRLVATVGHRKIGTIGIIRQTGNGGENLGYFADLRYEFLPGLYAKFYNSYYNYERATVEISQDALAFMVGLGYRIKNRIILDSELQQSKNNFYKSDVRGLVRFTYLFDF